LKSKSKDNKDITNKSKQSNSHTGSEKNVSNKIIKNSS
jgi:hypothetical protein